MLKNIHQSDANSDSLRGTRNREAECSDEESEKTESDHDDACSSSQGSNKIYYD